MAFEVIVKEANRKVATQAAADNLVAAIQQVFGMETSIVVQEVLKTYDGNSAAAKEIGVVTRVVAEYPTNPQNQ